MTYSSRFWLYAPLALFLALAFWAMGLWWSVARALDHKLIAMNGHQAIPGVTLSWASHRISGFPFRVDVVFNDLNIHAEAPRGAIIWHSDHFASHALTYGRPHEIFEAAGAQSLDWTDAGGVAHHLSFLPGTLRASAIADGKGLVRFDLDLVDAGGKSGDGTAFTLARGQFHMRRDPKDDALDLMISAVGAKGATPFGDRIASLEVYSRVTPAHDFQRLLAGRSGWMDALMAWRHDQGHIVNGPVHVEASDLKGDSADELDPSLRALLFPFY